MFGEEATEPRDVLPTVLLVSIAPLLILAVIVAVLAECLYIARCRVYGWYVAWRTRRLIDGIARKPAHRCADGNCCKSVIR